MKLNIIIEIGAVGFGVKYKQFDIYPMKWKLRAAIGFTAITLVWGDSMAIRAFAL